MVDQVYSERAALVAYLAAAYDSCFIRDENEPDWPVVLISLPTGQVSWHISPEDVKLFPHVKFDDSAKWDGHSTEEKYRRLNEFTQRIANAKRLNETENLYND